MKTTLSSIFLIIYSFSVYSQAIPDTLLLKENQRQFEHIQEDLRQRLLLQRDSTKKGGNIGAKTATTLSVNWQERGPDNMPSQVNKVIFDLNDPTGKKVWACSFGGLWSNNDITDANASWFLVNESIGFHSIAQDPTNPLIIFASTFGNLFKSIDGGNTWSNLTAPSVHMNNLVENADGVLFIYNFQNIYYSVDGGNSFISLLNKEDLVGGADFTDLDFDYENLIYVSLQNGKIFRSTSSTGGTWTNIMTSPLSASTVKTRLAISKDNANNIILYAANINQGTTTNTNWIRKSINGGITWVNLTIPSLGGVHTTAYSTNFDIEVGSTNPSKVIFSGQYFTSSTNGGASWKTPVFNNYLAGNIQIGQSDRVIAAINYGCTFSSNTFSSSPNILNSRNKNLNTSMVLELTSLNKYQDNSLFFTISGIGISIANSTTIGTGIIINGYNGIYMDTDERNNNVLMKYQPTIVKDDGTTIKKLYSGINGTLDFDKKNNILYQFRYSSSINNETFIRRVRNVGSDNEIIDDVRLAFYLSQVNFIKALNQSNSFLIQGDGKLYKIEVSNANIVNATLLNNTNFIYNFDTVVMVDRNNDNIINQARNDGFFRSTDGGIIWEEKFFSSGVTLLPGYGITSATNNPRNPNQVFILIGQQLFFTNDVSVASPIWENITGNLPQLFFGLFCINFRESDGMLAVGTFGRGVFTTDYFKNTVANEIIFSNYENVYCKNNDAKITFFANGAFSQSNTYRLELSDINGSFTSPRLLTTSNDSPIYARIPTDIPSGTGYRFRIVSTNVAVPIISAVSDALTITSGTNLFTAGYPQVVNPTDNGFVMNVKTSAAAKIYYIAVANNAEVPSSIQIVAGKNKDGNAGFKADSAVTVANEVQNIFVSGLSQGIDYDIYIVSKLPNEECYSDFVKVDVQTRGILLNYCTPVNTNACAGDNYISSVTLHEYNQTNSVLYSLSPFNSGCNPANFSINSSVVPSLFTGIYYTLWLKVHDYIGSFPDKKNAVWIDFDNDGNFSISENVVSYNQTSNYGTINIFLPIDTKPGIKRLRIRLTDNADLGNYSPCLPYNAGETEDYLLNVLTNEPFIYANLDKEQVGQCEVIRVLSNVTGTYNEGNLFRVELSDKTGDFTTPRVLLNNLANTLPVNIRLPKDIENGTNYQIRVVSTDPVATSFVSAGFTISPNTQSVSANYSSGSVLVNHIGTISATNQISGTAKVTYKAWNSIVLLPSFKAEPTAGGSFIAQIVGCEN